MSLKHRTKSPRYYIPDIPFFDTPPFYSGFVEQMKNIIKSKGGSNIRMRNKWDRSNLPKVITFSAGTGSLDDIEKELQSKVSSWVRIDNIVNWK